MYSANYLFRTGNVRWALDPLRLRQRLPQAPEMEVARDLSRCSFILLTHAHADHLDLELVASLREQPIRWVVPESILADVVEAAELPREKIIIPAPLVPILLEGVRIIPFYGKHGSSAAGSSRGIPATAYLIEFQGRRWLFPGDTRSYDASLLPSFGAVDCLFAHLWLGAGCAIMKDPPLLNAFCQFYIGLQPSRIVITHMEEFGRQANDYWDMGHFQKLAELFGRQAPGIRVGGALMGDSLFL